MQALLGLCFYFGTKKVKYKWKFLHSYVSLVLTVVEMSDVILYIIYNVEIALESLSSISFIIVLVKSRGVNRK